jgi:Zn-dependent protease/CBS domain-containing protein
MEALRLGKPFGIRVSIDWSLFFILALIVFNLGSGVFPVWHPDWQAPLRWGVALMAGLLFIGSVYVHELAHALVAKRYGMPVRSITLFLLGGVTNMEREPGSPRAEALMAIVGPLASLAIGFLFLLIGSWTADTPISADPEQAMRALGPLSTMLLWLGPINVILALFNLLPGFPLDGGRILRAILWGATGDLGKATRWAAAVGQAVGWMLVLAGISMIFGISVPIFGAGLVSGLWLAFIGWFLTSAAAGSYRDLLVRGMLEDVPVSRLLRRDVGVIDPNLPVSQLVDRIMSGDQHAFPVVAGDRLLGMVCLGDVRKIRRDAWDRVTVREIMTPLEDLAIVHPAQNAYDVLRILNRREVAQLPVVAEGRLFGIIRRQDIMRWLELQPVPGGEALEAPGALALDTGKR